MPNNKPPETFIMSERPSRYQRTQALCESNFGFDLTTVGIHSEQQFEVIIPEEEFSPAEGIMHLHDAYDLEFL